ncbi:MAG TPA: hypothetical protein PKL49_05880 [Steroidobacteraceae bacterium]|jgi:hypothetical protein|nr:hypothetical protein [Steroidobacteraceae bacterium]HNS27123.1 hypothetical protein [Steroidobacteraceae bacterium]
MVRNVRIVTLLVLALIAPAAWSAGVSGAQERAAQEFLAAVASGNTQAIAASLHPDELRRVRAGITARLRADAAVGDHRVRSRLFGEASNLGDIERLTDQSFFAAFGKRLRYPGRLFAKVKGLEAVKDGDDIVHIVIRGEQPEGRGKMRVVTLVTLMAEGRGWKAAMPSEVEAQIEDLLDGREPATGLVPLAPVASAAPGAAQAVNSPEIRSLLSSAAGALLGGHCDEYYGEYMSPNFRRSTSARALGTLVKSCERSDSMREMLVATLRIVDGSSPRYEQDGARARYDITGRGLPYDHFVLEKIDGRWYIAE